MADIVDLGNEAAETFLEAATKTRKPEGPKATGRCLNCGDYLPLDGIRWCDADCRDDWEKRNA